MKLTGSLSGLSAAARQQCVPWNNCPQFDAKAYACMDGLACQIGQLNCQGSCYK